MIRGILVRARVSRVRTTIACLLCLSFCFVAAGCFAAAAAAIAHKVGPAPKTDAVYPLPRVPTLVWVENYENPGQGMADAEQIARYIAEDLATAEKEEIVTIIPTTKAYDVRSMRPATFAKMKVSEIGAAVGAQQVIYVNMQSSGVAAAVGSDILRGQADGIVKVINTKNATTSWPQESTIGYPIHYETKLRRPGEGATQLTVREETLAGFGKKVGRLFHSWRADP